MEKILGKRSFVNFILELEKERSDAYDMISAYITNLSTIDKLNVETEVKEKIIEQFKKSAFGIVLFYWERGGKKIIIFPPFPLLREEIFYRNTFVTEQIREILTKKHVIGVILLHIGQYAVGIFENEKLISSKCGKHFVLRRQKKGGSSARRFQRIREKQIESFFNEVYDVVKEKFGPHIDKINYIIFGGPKLTIKKFQQRNHFMKKIMEKTLKKNIVIREANRENLEKSLAEIWKTRICELI